LKQVKSPEGRRTPEETLEFDKAKGGIVSVAGTKFMRLVLEPGWRWSESVKPIAKTDTCQASHLDYQVSGRLHVRMEDGTEMDLGPGDVSFIPPGHDAWVVGDEPVVSIDITGAKRWGKPA
jgi:hypothetical protein